MPKYELCYILAAGVSDDQVPAVTEQVKKFVSDFGGTDVVENQLGKKKLAYPIKKTRNGYYVVVSFDMDSRKINEFDAKIRSQTATIIRHLIVNLDEHLVKAEKDKVAQAKLSKRPPEEEETEAKPSPKAKVKEEVKEEKEEVKSTTPIDSEELDKKIEEALSESIK